MPKPPTQDERLEQVWAILTNPKQSIRSIQSVAAEHGFEDLTAFNKAFKARFGNSPVVTRKAARNPGGRGRRR